MLFAVVGAMVDMTFHIGGLLTFLGQLFLICYIGISESKNTLGRFSALYGVSFLVGTSLGHLIQYVILLDPR
jgi:hypothetical protein